MGNNATDQSSKDEKETKNSSTNKQTEKGTTDGTKNEQNEDTSSGDKNTDTDKKSNATDNRDRDKESENSKKKSNAKPNGEREKESEKAIEKTAVKRSILPPPIYVKECQLVLLGTIGSGKSATGNTLFFRKVFESQLSAKLVTNDIRLHRQKHRFYKSVAIVDTPGINVTHLKNVQFQREVKSLIERAVDLVYPGPQAFLFVVSIPRFSESDVLLANFIKDHMTKLVDRMIIVFTGFDVFVAQNKKILEFKQELPYDFKNFIDQCHHRVLLFDNGCQSSWSTGETTKDQNEQVENLCHKVETLSFSKPKKRSNREVDNLLTRRVNSLTGYSNVSFRLGNSHQKA